MERLFEQLERYGESDIYPCHMPGHKRQGMGALPKQLARLDITEIEGFDNLHQPQGILRNLQQYAAQVYGAEETFYLVNGSTCGILSAISAAVPMGGRLLIARNCHKSVYHGAYLRCLRLSYLYPALVPEAGICEAISPQQVQEALEREPDINGVLIVSPTYEGRIAEVEEIARIVHSHGIPLIVDEAHGAHLGFHPAFAEGSSRAGADLVVASVHKTLPAMTQTALLHVNGTLVDRRLVRRFLQIYQSSSPSYVLMASIDNAIHLAAEEGEQLFSGMLENWDHMLRELSACRSLTIWPPASLERTEYQRHQDIGKLVISVKKTEISGKQLYRELLEKYGLQMEMVCQDYVLAMFTIADCPQGYERLTKALLEIDERIAQAGSGRILQAGTGWGKRPESGEALRHRDSRTLSECWDQPVEWRALKNAVDRYAGEFVCIYPPGTPILVPGERLEETQRQLIEQCLADGLEVQGITRQDEEWGLLVLTEITHAGEPERRK